MNRPFQINIPLTKIDEEQRIVTGIATAEVLDSQGDIIDYEASKRAFQAWGGNIREMHSPVAVGKSIDIQFDDENKQVILSSYISESADGQNAWTKIKEGILTGYSIGGRMLEVVKDKAVSGANRIMEYTLSETSLVDNPACPTALFTMVKSVDGNLQRVEAVTEANDNPSDSWWIRKYMSKDIKKGIYDAQEAIGVASTLAYLIMCEQNEEVVDQDQLNDLTTAFNAVKDFVSKEVVEGDDYVTQYAEVMEMANKIIDLKKGAIMAQEIEKAGIAVVDGDPRDATATTVAPAVAKPVSGGTVVPKKVYAADGKTTTTVSKADEAEEVKVEEAPEVVAPVEEVAPVEAVEEPVEEVVETPAEEVVEPVVETPEAPVEAPAEVVDESAKSDSITDLSKNVKTLLAKLSDSSAGDALNKADFTKFSDKVEKMVSSLEGRITDLEKQPLPVKGKASFAVITKGDDEVEDNTKEELEKRQEAFIANPQGAPAGEAEAIAKGFRNLNREG